MNQQQREQIHKALDLMLDKSIALGDYSADFFLKLQFYHLSDDENSETICNYSTELIEHADGIPHIEESLRDNVTFDVPSGATLGSLHEDLDIDI